MTRAFHLYLQRSGDSQSKPMRQLLKVLVKLLIADVSNESSAFVIHDIILICLSHISSEEDLSCVKAAMTLITMFIQKRLISVELLLTSESTISPKIAMRTQIIQPQSGSVMQDSSPSLYSIVSDFVSQLMGWMQFADTGPSAGRLILALLRCIDDATHLEDPLASSNFSSWAPMWVEPLLEAVHQRPELIENLEQHLLPELLRINLFHTEQLLHSLPIEELCRGNIGYLTEEDLRLCLVVIRVVEELGETSFLGKAISSGAL